MAKIVIIGAGVMGTSLAVPGADNGHEMLLVGSPLDNDIIAGLRTPGGVHPKLDNPLPTGITPITEAELTPDHLGDADVIVAGVSSPGIGWFCAALNEKLKVAKPVAFVTKGLDTGPKGLASYADTLGARIANMAAFIGIGGPCIARELANRLPTACIYACTDEARARAFAALMATPYYRLSTTDDAAGVEACAALKNFFAIGVSAMQTAYRDGGRTDGQAKNPTAFAFTAACREMALLCERLGGRRDTAFALAGLGDLHVTVGGGRNSRLGHALGRGMTIPATLSGELKGETVEGVDTARALAAWFTGADPLPATEFPLAAAIVRAVLSDQPFSFDFWSTTVN